MLSLYPSPCQNSLNYWCVDSAVKIPLLQSWSIFSVLLCNPRLFCSRQHYLLPHQPFKSSWHSVYLTQGRWIWNALFPTTGTVASVVKLWLVVRSPFLQHPGMLQLSTVAEEVVISVIHCLRFLTIYSKFQVSHEELLYHCNYKMKNFLLYQSYAG